MALQEMDLEQKKQTRFNTKHFVFACAVFASLNSVLLGYGWYPFLSFLIIFTFFLFFIILIIIYGFQELGDFDPIYS